MILTLEAFGFLSWGVDLGLFIPAYNSLLGRGFGGEYGINDLNKSRHTCSQRQCLGKKRPHAETDKRTKTRKMRCVGEKCNSQYTTFYYECWSFPSPWCVCYLGLSFSWRSARPPCLQGASWTSRGSQDSRWWMTKKKCVKKQERREGGGGCKGLSNDN